MARGLRRLRTAAMTAGTLGSVGALAVGEAFELRRKWRTQLRSQATACSGPTEGLELRPAPSSRIGGAEGAAARGSTLLLFLGDSLVSGVGGEASGTPSPAVLPKNVAARLADSAGCGVRWASVGITGADVSRLTAEGLPKLKSKIAQHKDAATVVVVLVVGANDLRKMNFASYRLGVRRLVQQLRYITHEQKAVDAIVLPSISIPDAPMLQSFPLQCFLRPVCALWEREKRKAVTWISEAVVVPAPDPRRGVDDPALLFSADQLHPSASGYERWAESLAGQIHELLSQQQKGLRVGAAAEPPRPPAWGCRGAGLLLAC